jgi:hypothetical protein
MVYKTVVRETIQAWRMKYLQLYIVWIFYLSVSTVTLLDNGGFFEAWQPQFLLVSPNYISKTSDSWQTTEVTKKRTATRVRTRV